MIIKDIDEMFVKICEELKACGFKEYEMDVNEFRYVNDGNSLIVGKHDSFIQIYNLSSNDWEMSVFPLKCIVSISGHSLFYHGRLAENE